MFRSVFFLNTLPIGQTLFNFFGPFIYTESLEYLLTMSGITVTLIFCPRNIIFTVLFQNSPEDSLRDKCILGTGKSGTIVCATQSIHTPFNDEAKNRLLVIHFAGQASSFNEGLTAPNN